MALVSYAEVTVLMVCVKQQAPAGLNGVAAKIGHWIRLRWHGSTGGKHLGHVCCLCAVDEFVTGTVEQLTRPQLGLSQFFTLAQTLAHALVLVAVQQRELQAACAPHRHHSKPAEASRSTGKMQCAPRR